jgi:hypothetical protein
MTRIPCPYCSQIVDAGAVACSTCGGLLKIGSHLAIRQALAADPTLSLKDPETVARLKEFVAQIDESISKSNREKLDAQIQNERAEREALQIQQEQIKAKEREKEKARNDYLDSLPPLKKFVTVRKLPITLLLVGIVLSLLIVPNQVVKAREESERALVKEQKIAAAEAAKASEQSGAVASAAQDIAAIEAKYCSILDAATQDSEFQRYINWNTYNMSEVERDAVKEMFIVDLQTLYTEYTSIGVKLGSERENFLSPILELHLYSYDRKDDISKIVAQCSL